MDTQKDIGRRLAISLFYAIKHIFSFCVLATVFVLNKDVG